MDIFGNSNENGGDIIGPASSTTNALVRYADTTGKLLKNSTVTLSDDGTLTGLKIITPLTGWPLQLYGDLDMGQNFIIDLATPVNDFDAATKEYVDGKAGNQTATTGLTTFTGTVEAGILKKTGGTSIQYMMADGSILSQSASSGNSNFYLYKSHTNTPTPPPTAGFVYYNNAIQKNATIIYISHLTEDNIDIEIFFQNLSTLNEVYIQQKILSDNFIKYNITGTPTVVTGSHISIPVAQVSFGGTGETSFGTNEPILVSFFTNNLEVDTRLSNVETKTQNQTAVAGTTNFLGTTAFNAGFYDQQIKFRFNTALNHIDSLMSGGTGFANLYLNALKVITSVVEIDVIRTDGSQITIETNLDMSQNSIHDLATPLSDYEAANKLYVDGLVGSHPIYTTSTFPMASTNVGRVIYNSDTNSLFLSNGVTWSEIFSWTQPRMTSMTSPSPYIVTTSSELPVGSSYKAFDRLLTSNNWWHTATGLYNSAGDYVGLAGKPGIANNGEWLVLQMDVARSISRYTYHTRHDGIDGMIRSWHIIYSNDGINYFSADNKANMGLVLNTTYTYTFPPVTAKYWGIQVYKVNGTGTIHITQDLTFYSI